MRHTLLSLCLLTAACGRGASSSGPTVGNVTAAPAVTGPAPTVAWTDTGFALTGLPAVSADGTKLLIAVMLEDGGRGFPNLTVLVKDRADAVAHQQVVLALDEQAMDQLPPSETALAEVNAYLERTHGELGWQPMQALEAGRDEATGEFRSAVTGDGVALTWAAPRLTVEADGAVVFEREFPAWESAPYDVDGLECANPSYLGAVHLDAARKVAIVTVSYQGHDTCWEPDSQQHVVAWE